MTALVLYQHRDKADVLHKRGCVSLCCICKGGKPSSSGKFILLVVLFCRNYFTLAITDHQIWKDYQYRLPRLNYKNWRNRGIAVNFLKCTAKSSVVTLFQQCHVVLLHDFLQFFSNSCKDCLFLLYCQFCHLFSIHNVSHFLFLSKL